MQFSMHSEHEFTGYFSNGRDNTNYRTMDVTQEVESVASEDEFVIYYHGDVWVSCLSVLLLLIMLVAITGNLLVIISIGMYKRMRKKTNLFLLNLAVADFLVAVMAMPFSLVTLVKGTWVFGNVMCLVNGFLEATTLMASIHTLMHMAVYEYIRITRPLSTIMTKRKVELMLLASWLIPALFNAASVSGWTHITYKIGSTQCGPVIPKTASQISHAVISTVFNLLLPSAAIIFCYGRIHKEAMQHYNRMQERGIMDKKFSSCRRRNTCITVIAVILCFLICWAPYLFYANFVIIFPNSEKLPLIINPVAYLFGYMNSACNPIIYALRYPEFRETFQQILCGKKPNQAERVTPKANSSEATTPPISVIHGNV